MTPRFAQVVDPIFLATLDLIDRINRSVAVSVQDERVRLRELFDRAEAALGGVPEWLLAKYALVSWIDELLVDLPWSGREWWGNNVFEVELFNTRLCNERFFVRAKEAATLANRDALEVFYDCVLLGFRGLYRDARLAEALTRSHGLPSDLMGWLRQAEQSIHLSHERRNLEFAQFELVGAPPLKPRSALIWSWILVALMVVVNVMYFFVIFLRYR
jgi:type VI secretion system protein ImpK